MIRQAFPKSNEKVKKKVEDILNSGMYVKGPEAKNLEEQFSSISQCKYNITCNSGTSALNLIFYALDYPPGSEIILPANSFLASANAIETAGYKPVFCDIDETNLNMDISSIDKLISNKTKAIMVVHLYGTPTNMDLMLQICSKNNIDLIEDSAQAHDAEFNGKKVGSFGIVSAFSLFPTKNLSVLGDGGIVSTNNKELAERIRALKNAGRTDHPDDAVYFGYNFRLSEVLAGICNVLLEDFPNETEKRREIANIYTTGLDGIGDIILPRIPEGAKPVWHQYTIRTEHRDKLKQYLIENGVQSSIKYSIPLPLVKSFKNKYGYEEGQYPKTEKASKTLLCLPMHPHLTKVEVSTVISKIQEFFTNRE